MPTAETHAEALVLSAAYVCTPGSTLTPWTPASDPLAGMSQCLPRFQSGCARWLGPAGCAWPPSAQTAAGLTGLASVQTSALSFCQACLVLMLTAPLAQLSRPGHLWVCVLLPSSGLHPACPTLLPGVKALLGSAALLRTYRPATRLKSLSTAQTGALTPATPPADMSDRWWAALKVRPGVENDERLDLASVLGHPLALAQGCYQGAFASSRASLYDLRIDYRDRTRWGPVTRTREVPRRLTSATIGWLSVSAPSSRSRRTRGSDS